MASRLLVAAESQRVEAELLAVDVSRQAGLDREAADSELRGARTKATQLLEEAESERVQAEQVAAEIVDAAQRQAEEIAEDVRTDRQRADRTVIEARQQLQRFAEETEAAAEDRVSAVMDGAVVHLDVLRRELEHVEELRDDTLGALSRLRTSLEDLRV